MNILYATDHRFLKCGDAIYSLEFDNRFFSPYRDSFGDIGVVGRYIESVDVEGMDRVDVDFTPIPDISTLSSFFGLRRDVEHILTDRVKSSDLVIARLPSEIALLSIEIARRVGKPFLVEVAGDGYEILKNYGTIRAYLYAPILKKRISRAVKSAKYIVYVTESYLQSRYPPPKYALIESISNVRLSVAPDEVIEKRENRFDSSSVVFGVIANIDMKFKGIDILIEAFGLYHREFPKSILKIAGSGDSSRYSRQLERLDIVDSVIFEGVIYDESKKWRWLDEIDIYIQPSLSEGLPRALIEAMGRGCICIASDVGGIPELLDRQYLFKSGDYLSLYNKMCEVLGNIVCKNILIANRDRIISKYNIEILYRRKIDIFQYIIKDNKY